MAAHQRRLRQLGRQLGSGRAAPAAAATAATEDAASVEGHAARMAELFELLAPIAAEAGVSEVALATARSVLLEAVAEASYDPTILGPYSHDMMPAELRGLVSKGMAGLDTLVQTFSLQRPTPPAPPKRLWDQRPVVRKAVGQPEGADSIRAEPGYLVQPALRPADGEPDVVVVGGAAAGLAAGACLNHLGVSNIVLDSGDAIGGVWQGRYERLHLHDIIDQCHLPHLPMPDSCKSGRWTRARPPACSFDDSLKEVLSQTRCT